MDEYAALAQRVVLTMDDVQGCLVLSRDGLVLGAFPESEEGSVKPSWLRFTHVGEARRGFVEFGDQIWAYIHRGPYAAFVVSGTTVRPGVLLDQLEQALLVAEDTRAKRDTLKVPDAQAAPSGRPRTSLHPPAERAQPVDVSAAAGEGTEQVGRVGAWKRPAAEPVEAVAQHQAAPAASAPPSVPPAALGPAAGGAGLQPPLTSFRRPGAAAPASGGGGTGLHPPVTSFRRPEGATAGGGGGTGLQPPATSFHRPEAVPPGDDGTPPPAFASSPFAEFAELAGSEATGDRSAEAEGPMPDDAATTTAPIAGDGAAPETAAGQGEEEAPEIDRVLLAKEFSGLLQMGEDGDEGSS